MADSLRKDGSSTEPEETRPVRRETPVEPK